MEHVQVVLGGGDVLLEVRQNKLQVTMGTRSTNTKALFCDVPDHEHVTLLNPSGPPRTEYIWRWDRPLVGTACNAETNFRDRNELIFKRTAQQRRL